MAVFGYFYTVRPVYQKELLSEQIARLQRTLPELQQREKALQNKVAALSIEREKALRDQAAQQKQFSLERERLAREQVILTARFADERQAMLREQESTRQRIEQETARLKAEHLTQLAASETRRQAAETKAARSHAELRRINALQAFQRQAATHCLAAFDSNGGADATSFEACMRAPVWGGPVELQTEDKEMLRLWINREASEAAKILAQPNSEALALGWTVLRNELGLPSDLCPHDATRSLRARSGTVDAGPRRVPYDCHQLSTLAEAIARMSAFYSAVQHATSTVALNVAERRDASAPSMFRPMPPTLVVIE